MAKYRLASQEVTEHKPSTTGRGIFFKKKKNKVPVKYIMLTLINGNQNKKIALSVSTYKSSPGKASVVRPNARKS